jgi:hypothetical protein
MKYIWGICLLAIIGCAKTPSVNDISWLLGNWIQKKDSIQFVENWKLESDTLKGIASELINGDSIFSEKLQIVKQDDKLSFSAIVSNQNNQKPVTFTMVYLKNDSIVFENKEHDFPNRIIYCKKNSQEIKVYVQSIKNPQMNFELNYNKY